MLAAFVDDLPEPAVAAEHKLRPVLFIVVSPNPATGKTFIARLLVDFLRQDGGPVEAFELAPGDTALSDILPALTTRSELGSTRAQIALFDRLILNDGVPRVVDLGH